MNKKLFFPIFCALLIVVSLLVINGCGSAASSGGGGGSSIANRTGTFSYAGIQAPGEIWSWTISTETFSGTNETTGAYITGEWTILASGFGTMHVIGASTGDAVGKDAYFLEYKDTAIMVFPVGEVNNAIVCAARATAALTTGPKYICIKIPNAGPPSLSDVAYITAEVTWAGNLATFEITEYMISGEYRPPRGGDTLTFSSSTGMLTPIAANPERLFLTPSGMFIVDNGPGAGGAIGASKESFSSIEAANHEYRGVDFRYFPSGTSETYFIAATNNGSGSLKGYMYNGNNVESGIDTSSFVTFTFQSQEATGIISTEVTQGAYTTTVKSVFAKIGANQKYIWFGFNVNASGGQENILFMQTN